MVHNMSLSLDLSDRLLVTQRDIHYLRTWLADIGDTLRACLGIQAGEDSDFYSTD
jgi:hypothetical protein